MSDLYLRGVVLPYLFELNQDLARHQENQPFCVEENEDVFRQLAVMRLAAGLAIGAFSNSAGLLANPAPDRHPQESAYRLTRLTGKLLATHSGVQPAPSLVNDPVDYIGQTACFEAELRLMRSLDFHTSPAIINPCHRPAIIYFDARDQPYAYEKASGNPIAYAWRDARISTANGPCWVPANSFLAMQYADKRLVEEHTGARLIALHNPNLKQVDFLRFSTHCLPQLIRRCLSVYGASNAQTSKLNQNITAANQFTPEHVAHRAYRLLDSLPKYAHIR